VILYNEDNEIMEATIANIAIEVPNPESGKLEWITPPVSSGTFLHDSLLPPKGDDSLFWCPVGSVSLNSSVASCVNEIGLLAGTMRRYLLEKGELREGVVTVDELKEAARVSFFFPSFLLRVLFCCIFLVPWLTAGRWGDAPSLSLSLFLTSYRRKEGSSASILSAESIR